MRIQIWPPRRTWRVIARRADSICRLVIQEASSACSPKVPKAMWLPRWAAPRRWPRWILRCLVRFGISMASLLLHLGLHGLAGLGGSGLARRGRLAACRGPLGTDLRTARDRVGVGDVDAGDVDVGELVRKVVDDLVGDVLGPDVVLDLDHGDRLGLGLGLGLGL